jgi:type IV pilus assembly protein PilY1
VDKFNSTATGQATGSPTTVPLSNLNPIWEAGKQLALMDPTTRTILTWVDTNNNGRVDPGEQIPFTTANDTQLAPYLRAGAAPFTADNIINFIRGVQVPGLRSRQLTLGSTARVWKLGDVVNSSPTAVSRPRERYDVLYGDASYSAYYQRYRNRRTMVYVGANDGMLHAFNAGFYHPGDDPTTPSSIEHGWFTTNPTDNSSGAALGTEQWAYIPYQLLPFLGFLTDPSYTHVYYVDLKPKITDARIFPPDADHPNGWGTILIGGMRLGGSCGACTSAAPPHDGDRQFRKRDSDTFVLHGVLCARYYQS